MELIVFEKEAYYGMLEEVKGLVKRAIEEAIVGQRIGKGNEEWIDAEEAKKLLGVRSKTKMQQLRDQAQIKFSQHGRKIKYSRKSIVEFLNENVPKY
jgi:hypothetical protein